MDAEPNRQRQLHQQTSGMRPRSAGRGKRVDGIGAQEMNAALSAALARFARGEFVHGPRGSSRGSVGPGGGDTHYDVDMVMMDDANDGGEG